MYCLKSLVSNFLKVEEICISINFTKKDKIAYNSYFNKLYCIKINNRIVYLDKLIFYAKKIIIKN